MLLVYDVWSCGCGGELCRVVNATYFCVLPIINSEAFFWGVGDFWGGVATFLGGGGDFFGGILVFFAPTKGSVMDLVS